MHDEIMDELNDWETFGKVGNLDYVKNTHNAENILRGNVATSHPCNGLIKG